MLVFERQIPGIPTYYYRSNAESDREFPHDIVQVWAEVFKRIRENRADGTWNRLVFECWCVEGYVEIYPQLRGQSPDAKTPLINVSLKILDGLRAALEETEDDAQFRSLVALVYTNVRGNIRNMYRREPALTEIKKVLESNDFTCWTMKNDDIETLMKFDIFF